MGAIRVRPETGTLFLDYRVNGKRYRKQSDLGDTPENRCALERELAVLENAVAIPSSTSTNRHLLQTIPAAEQLSDAFEDFAVRFFREQSVGWRPNTRDWARSIYNTHLIPAFRGRQLHEIKREDVLEFRVCLAETEGDDESKRRSNKTINVVMRMLKALLTEASERYGFPNPTARIKRLKVPRKDIQPFTLEEVKLLLENVRKDFKPYLTVAFFTGMRPGELHGLKWEYVDFEARRILVRETYTKGRVEYTKTDGSQREIAMSPLVWEALQAQHKLTGSIAGYVFCSRVGTPLNAKNFSDRVWHPLLRHLGMRRRVPYQTRHTAATLWLASGENPEWIAAQLGHTTTEMLFRVYSRYVPNLTRRDGSAFEQLLADRGLIKFSETSSSSLQQHAARRPRTGRHTS